MEKLYDRDDGILDVTTIPAIRWSVMRGAGESEEIIATNPSELAAAHAKLAAPILESMVSERVKADAPCRFAVDIDKGTSSEASSHSVVEAALVGIASSLFRVLLDETGGAAIGPCIVASVRESNEYKGHLYWPLLRTTRGAAARLGSKLKAACAASPYGAVVDTNLYAGPWTQLRVVGSPKYVRGSNKKQDSGTFSEHAYQVCAVLTSDGLRASASVEAAALAQQRRITTLGVAPWDGVANAVASVLAADSDAKLGKRVRFEW
jgi:hypothetical protein